MTARSRILERKGKLEMGRKLLRLSRAMLGFFGTGVIAAVLRTVGTMPVLKDSCIILRTMGQREEKQDWNKVVGMGSKIDVVGFMRVTSLFRDAESRREKLERREPEKLDEEGGGVEIISVVERM